MKMNIKITQIGLPRGNIKIRKLLHLYQILKKKKDYVIQTWLYHADFLGGVCAKLAGNKKIIWNIRTSEIFVSGLKLSTLFVIFLNALFSYFVPKKIIICSKNSISKHLRVGYKKNFEIIHNGYDLKLYPYGKKKTLKKKDFKLTNKDFVIGNVARFHPVKNHKYLLKIFNEIKIKKKIPKLILVGSKIDNNNKILIKMIKEMKLEKKVILLGKREDVIKIYPIFDVFILSSTSEGFPNSLSEAMINKNVVFSTNVGEVNHILPNSGNIIPLNNYIESAKKINNYFNRKNKNQIQKDKTKNKERITKFFSLNKMTKKYLKLWKF